MNKKVLLFIAVLLCSFVVVKAQEDTKITIKGIIEDAITSEPIPFANLGVLGTLAGVASDMDGKFELVLPESYADKKVRVSVVGYSPYETSVTEIRDNENLRIRLSAMTYTIKGVDVYGQSMVYKKILKKAVENISRNYFNKPYNYTGYFQYTTAENGALTSSKEAIVTVYDTKGYVRSDVETAFKELNYRFSEVRRKEEPRSVLDGLMYFDDILTADIVKNTRNILDIDNARDYKLSNRGNIVFEGDSVQIIGYEVTNPTISTTGDAGVSKYRGEIYVNLKDYAVLKNVMHVSSQYFNSLGRNLIPAEEEKNGNTEMTITTSYKKLNHRYFLSGATVSYRYKEKDGKKITGKMQYVTTRVNAQNPEAITGRMYYENIKANPKFWNNYTVYFEE